MSVMKSTGDRLRRATTLWHCYLAATGERFDLALFLKDAAIEKQTIESALASADQKLVTLAQEWLRDTGQAVPAVVASRVTPPASVPGNAASSDAEPATKPSRYLRGVR
jgi:hypothetical protein